MKKCDPRAWIRTKGRQERGIFQFDPMSNVLIANIEVDGQG